ncbi:hypothetical protein AB1Y20_003534 [Prymnesium parvum]|uniref:Phosphorylated adapter RNA export protein n=1 Tax=Prymnesium parvum TaxID=97485 RepID=A0AB34J6J2_PRYPA
MSLDSLAEPLREMTHAFGSSAYTEAWKHRGSELHPPPPERPLQPYDEDVYASACPSAAAAPPVKWKKRSHSVALPQWMDLDQETLPRHAPIAVSHDTTRSRKQSTREPALALRPSKLAAFGGVGELTVQLRTERAAESDALGFDALLSSYSEEKRVAAERRDTGDPTPKAAASSAEAVCKRCRERGHWVQQCKVPREGYVCNVCKVPGHYIHNCPEAARLAALRAEGSAPQPEDGQKRGKRKVPGPGYICYACNEPGHFIEDCPKKGSGAPRTAPPPSYVCRRCGQAGHWKEQCAAAARPREAAAEAELAAVDGEAAEVGGEIAEALEESDADAVATISRAVAVLGEEAARMLLVQTWQVEEQGGLLTLDGSCRRRTAGGVYLWLVKQQADAAQRRRIWADRSSASGAEGAKRRKLQRKHAPKEGAPQPAALAASLLGELSDLIDEQRAVLAPPP